jgi:Fucose permease
MAIVVGIVGVFLQYMSGWDSVQSFYVYLIGAFIAGFCMCMLNTVVNPLLNILGGGGNKGNQLIQFGGVLNSFSAVAVTIIMGSLIGTVTKETQIAQATPALFIALGIFALAFIVLLFTTIDEPNQGTEEKGVKDKYSAFSFRHFKLGILAIFLYMGVEVGVPTYILQYLTSATDAATPGLGMDASIAGLIVAVYWFLMLIGRLLGGILGAKFSSRTQISFVATLCCALVLFGMFGPDVMVSIPGVNWTELSLIWAEVPIGIFALVLVGLCTSVMWGGIFNMAVEGLGKYTAIASGAFMTMVCGGGILIPLQGYIADLTGSFLTSYIVVLVCAFYILFYALFGYKNVNKDIPTE